MTKEAEEYFLTLPYPSWFLFNFIVCIYHQLYLRNPTEEMKLDFDKRLNNLYHQLLPLSKSNVYKVLVAIQEEIERVFEKSHLTYIFDGEHCDWVVYDKQIDGLVTEIQTYLKGT